MKTTFFIFLVFSFTYLNAFSEDDFRIDPKTSRALPNFSGKIILLKGKVVKISVDRPDGKKLKVGTKVFVGEKIVTGKGSLLKMRMVDDSVITLGPNSKLLIKKFDYETKNKRTAVYTLLNGKFRGHISRKVPKGHSVRIETKQAAMGIRGTEVLVNLYIDKKLKSVTQMALISGSAVVHNKVVNTTKVLKVKDQLLIAGTESVVDFNKLIQLSDEEFKKLSDATFNADDTFPSMLNYKSPYVSSVNYDKHNNLNLLSKTKNKQSHFKQPRGQWQKKLKNLNDKLKENNEL